MSQNKIVILNKNRKSNEQFLTLNDKDLPVPVFSFPICSFLVASLSAFCFWMTQWADFTFDDNSAILSNNDVQSDSSIWNVFQNDFWGTNIKSNLSHKSYRPLTVLSFKLNYFLAGGYKPWGFHLVNIVLHSINSVFILQVFSVLFGGIMVGLDGRRVFTSPKASFLCAILFAVHPIHTESVSFASFWFIFCCENSFLM